LEQGTGVCQDHAHIFCAVCRTLGVPARYVSGYLTHGAGHEAHASSHAWAEAFVDFLGWIGFDPTNRACATDAYVRTAVGLDYAEAGPVRGVRSGGGTETMRVTVSFPGQQQQVQ
jgi:transglutaminase-like putative cysteine protease